MQERDKKNPIQKVSSRTLSLSLSCFRGAPPVPVSQNPSVIMASKRKSTGFKLPSYLKPGSEVEITSEEPGFQGSLYAGTVIRRFPSNNSEKLLVEFKDLFADGAGERPLRETFDWFQLRPVAPREKTREFKFSEEVDAYHLDGWWEGTITVDHGDGKFSVFFRKSREQIKFGAKDLRLHREFVNGAWIPPLEEEKIDDSIEKNIAKRQKVSANVHQLKDHTTIAQIKYGIGSTVEVRSDDEGFLGAWLPATIIKPCADDKKYLVEYKTLRSDDDKEFLKEELDISHIRPPPPERIAIDGFEKLDKVEAWYNDVWWIGVISKILADSKYIVYFKNTGETIKIAHSNLRLHQEWVNGEWVKPSKSRKL